MKKYLIIGILALGTLLTGCSARVYSDGYGYNRGYYNGGYYGPYYGPSYGYRPYYRPRVYRAPAPRVYRKNWNRNNSYRPAPNTGGRRNDSFRGNRGGGPRSRGPR